MPLPSQVSTSAKQLVLSAIFAIGLIVLIAFPCELFNNTLEENYDEVRRWFRLGARVERPSKRSRRTLAFVVFLVIGALLYSLLSPSFGTNESSLALMLAMIVTLATVTIAFNLPDLIYMRRRHGERGRFRVLPGTLAVAAVCVVLSRVLHFQPGYLYGLIAGFVFGRELSKDAQGRLTAVSSLCVLLVSTAAWVACVPVATAASKPNAGMAVVVLQSALAAIAVAGLQSVVFGLLPLRFLDGRKVMDWSRAAWVALFGLGLFAFVHILLRPSSGYVGQSDTGGLVMVVGLFVAFGLLSVLFWAYFRFRSERPITA
jgi:dolichol kinase